MTFEERVNRLIGKKYDAENYHCWNLVCDLVPDAPRLEGSAQSLTSSVKSFKIGLTYRKFNEVDEYEDKDIIVLGRFDTYYHAGVYYKGGIIHADNSGVVYQSMKDIRRLYSLIKGLRV